MAGDAWAANFRPWVSAGLAIAVKSSYAVIHPKEALKAGNLKMASNLEATVPHRALATYVQGIFGQGLLCVTVYLFSRGGLGSENWELLCTIARYLTAAGLPFCVAGDFQVDPRDIESGLLGVLRARCVHIPSSKTVKSHLTSQGTYTNIDYFLVSNGLYGFSGEPYPDLGVSTKPHHPVVSDVLAHPHSMEIEVLDTPPEFPRITP